MSTDGTAAFACRVDPLFEGIKIVDCDTHFTEPPDLFAANAPAGLKEKMPQVRRVNGIDYWFIGEKNFGSLGGKPPPYPVVGMTSTPTGKGYWMLTSDGQVSAFGDAQFFGHAV